MLEVRSIPLPDAKKARTASGAWVPLWKNLEKYLAVPQRVKRTQKNKASQVA